ncbi:MAG: choice-of-anchor D domain-containing protein [Deltaproteobacteria bacterium]|nr:choice-of-anchor D domain-containing protein [Deltaproteobacteria bacterium]
MTLRRFAVLPLLLLSWACPDSQPTDEGSSGGPHAGSPCTLDSDCAGLICLNGVCAATTGGSSGGTTSGGLSSSSSSGGSSGATAGSSSGAVDGGTVDAAVPAGHITLSPDASSGPLEFGATRIGFTVEKNVLVTNDGVAPASLISLAFRDNPSGEFTLEVVGGQPAALGVGTQITVRIRHTARDATGDHATLMVVTNASNALVELPLLAEFKGDPTMIIVSSPDATADVTQAQVPPTPVGTPVTLHLFVKNNGASNSALAVTSVALDPPVSSLFSVAAGPMPRSISTYPGACTGLADCGVGAASCTGGLCVSDQASGAYPVDIIDIALTFNAGAAGDANTELVVTADVAGAPTTRRIPVAALGQDSRVDVTPSPIAFGSVFVNRTVQQQVTLANPADAANVLELLGTAVRYSPAPYTVELGGVTFPYPLTPGSSVVVTVTFAPTNAGTFNNSLALTRTAGLPVYVPITGVGALPPHADIPATLPFGGAIPGSPKTLPLAVGNTGAGPLSVTSLSVTPSTAPFAVALSSLPDVPSMQTANVNVTYSPANIGDTDAATLLVQTNDPDQPLIQVALTGQGVSPGALVNPEGGVDFGSVLIGTSPAVTRTITVSNSGTGSLTVDSPAVVKNTTNVTIPQYTVTPSRTLPASITSGDGMTFTLAFAPAAAQAYPGSIVITTNDPSHPTYTIPVTGSGNNCSPLPNTSVSVVNGTQCVYACVANAVQCSDQSCVSCPARHGANPSCAAGNACQYTCPANTGEPADPPGACSTSLQNLGDIYGDSTFASGNPQTTTSFRVYPAGDHDWFKFRLMDHLDFLEGGFGFWIPTLRAEVTLSDVAQGEQLGVELREGSCTGGGPSGSAAAGQAVAISTATRCDGYTLYQHGTPSDTNDDTIGPWDDSDWIYVHVYPLGDSYQCTSYTLNVRVYEELEFLFACLGAGEHVVP